RIVVVQKVIAKTVGPLTPTVTGIFDAIKKAATDYIVDWNGGYLYQVTGPYRDQCVVNMDRRVCSCRKWELTGIPCKHVVAAIYNMSENRMGVGILEHWVHAAYKLRTWAHVYSFKIYLCNGREIWHVVESRTVIIPPNHKPQVGRPPKKKKKGCKGQGGASQAGGSSQQSQGPRQGAGARNASSQAAGSSQPSATPSQASQGPSQHSAGPTQASQGPRQGFQAPRPAPSSGPQRLTKKSASRHSLVKPPF
ncbi:mutator type transposase, partial [Tanacetum coccineum]